ncbi:MAG: hypothetical protein HY361_00535 [Candidatus Aenigmarchaeota archaeon]|nr:hypothetical protein [Candidatus Aenigmarchaeota archaeon]
MGPFGFGRKKEEPLSPLTAAMTPIVEEFLRTKKLPYPIGQLRYKELNPPSWLAIRSYAVYSPPDTKTSIAVLDEDKNHGLKVHTPYNR